MAIFPNGFKVYISLISKQIATFWHFGLCKSVVSMLCYTRLRFIWAPLYSGQRDWGPEPGSAEKLDESAAETTNKGIKDVTMHSTGEEHRMSHWRKRARTTQQTGLLRFHHDGLGAEDRRKVLLGITISRITALMSSTSMLNVHRATGRTGRAFPEMIWCLQLKKQCSHYK